MDNLYCGTDNHYRRQHSHFTAIKKLALLISIFLCLPVAKSCSESKDEPILKSGILSVYTSLVELTATDVNTHRIPFDIEGFSSMSGKDLEYTLRYDGNDKDWLEVVIDFDSRIIDIRALTQNKSQNRNAYLDLTCKSSSLTITVKQNMLSDTDDCSSILEKSLYEYLLFKGFGTNGRILAKDLAEIEDLGDLRCKNSSLLTISDFSVFSYFRKLRIIGNPDSKAMIHLSSEDESVLDFKHIPNIEQLCISSNSLKITNIEKAHNLRRFKALNVNNTGLDFSKSPELEYLSLDANKCESINIGNLPKLNHLSVNSQISKLDIKHTALRIGAIANGSQSLEIYNSGDSETDFTLYIGEEQINGTESHQWQNNIRNYHNVKVVCSNEKAPRFHVDFKLYTESIEGYLYVDDPGFPPIKESGYLSYCISREPMDKNANYTNTWLRMPSAYESPIYTEYIKANGLDAATDYYIKMRVANGIGTYYYTEQFLVTTLDYVAPEFEFGTIDTTHNTAVINFFQQNPGSPQYKGAPYIAIGRSRNFNINDAEIILSMSNWSSDNGRKSSCVVTKLLPECTYFAKIFVNWRDFDRYQASDVIEFKTSKEPEPVFSVYIDSFKISRLGSNYMGNGLTHYQSQISAIAYYRPSDKPVSVYFETDNWGNYYATITEPGVMVCNETIDWYLNSQPRPYMSIRAVLIYNDKKFYSNWMTKPM